MDEPTYVEMAVGTHDNKLKQLEEQVQALTQAVVFLLERPDVRPVVGWKEKDHPMKGLVRSGLVRGADVGIHERQ